MSFVKILLSEASINSKTIDLKLLTNSGKKLFQLIGGSTPKPQN
jgi:hypothetical protein